MSHSSSFLSFFFLSFSPNQQAPRGDVNGNWSHDLYGTAGAVVPSMVAAPVAPVSSTKLVVSNLDAGVTDEDIMVCSEFPAAPPVSTIIRG